MDFAQLAEENCTDSESARQAAASAQGSRQPIQAREYAEAARRFATAARIHLNHALIIAEQNEITLYDHIGLPESMNRASLSADLAERNAAIAAESARVAEILTPDAKPATRSANFQGLTDSERIRANGNYRQAQAQEEYDRTANPISAHDEARVWAEQAERTTDLIAMDCAEEHNPEAARDIAQGYLQVAISAAANCKAATERATVGEERAACDDYLTRANAAVGEARSAANAIIMIVTFQSELDAATDPAPKQEAPANLAAVKARIIAEEEAANAFGWSDTRFAFELETMTSRERAALKYLEGAQRFAHFAKEAAEIIARTYEIARGEESSAK